MSVVDDVLDEVHRAIAKFPTWPDDPFHALAVLGEEFGELTKATLQMVYEPHKLVADEAENRMDQARSIVREEAVQTAAMALRFLAAIDSYSFDPCPQHAQSFYEEEGA